MAEILGGALLCDKCEADLSWAITLLSACRVAGCEIVAVALRCRRCGNSMAVYLRWSGKELTIMGLGFKEGVR